MRLTHPVLGKSVDVPDGSVAALRRRGWITEGDEPAPDLPPPADETPVSEGDESPTPHEED